MCRSGEQVIKMAEDAKMISLSLNGFKHSIRIAARFNLPTARDLLVTTLYKFTTLAEIREVRKRISRADSHTRGTQHLTSCRTVSCAPQVKPRNIECIKTLISVALMEGNYLQVSARLKTPPESGSRLKTPPFLSQSLGRKAAIPLASCPLSRRNRGSTSCSASPTWLACSSSPRGCKATMSIFRLRRVAGEGELAASGASATPPPLFPPWPASSSVD